MSTMTTNLGFRQIYGIRNFGGENIAFVDNHQVVYIGGHTIVMYNKSDKRQRFIHLSEVQDNITAFTSESGKKLCAVAERGDRPLAHVFDLRTCRKKKSLCAQDVNSKEFVSMKFSEDSALLLTLTGAPDWTLLCWNWSRNKMVASLQVSNSPVSRCTFSPIDASIACVTGGESVKFFRIAERDMRPLKENEYTNTKITCHCWLREPEDHCVAATEAGQLILFKSSEYVCHVDVSPGREFPITSLISYAEGIIVGTTNGTLQFYQIDPAKSYGPDFTGMFTMTKTISTELTSGSVTSMTMNPDQDLLTFVSSDSQMICVPMIAVNSLTDDDCYMLQCSFHGPAPITGMDVCIRKPLMVSCSKDNSLRVWNYQTNEVELLKHYLEDMYSVAIHPTGLQLALGFADKIRIYHILVDDLRPCLEISIKACRECRFSPLGNMLAAVNGNTVQIFDFHTGEKIADLRGHNGKVRSISWDDTNFRLLSSGQDGAIYRWNLEGKRLADYVQKGVMYTDAISCDTGVFAVGSDSKLTELEPVELQKTQERNADVLLTHLRLASTRGLLLAGTGQFNKPAIIRAYQYPLNGECVEWYALATETAMMRLTFDELFLIVADNLGTITIFELRDRQKQFSRNPAQLQPLMTSPNWTDETLVTRSELDDKTSSISELRTKVDELRVHIEYQLKLKEMNYSEKIKEVTDKFVQELDQARTRYELLKEERSDLELEYTDKLKHMEEKFQHDMQEVETVFQSQIMEKVEAYQILVKERDAQMARLQDQRARLVKSHEDYIDQMTYDFNRKVTEEIRVKERIIEEKDEQEKTLNEIKDQLEDDIDTEIESLRKIYHEKVVLSREATLKYKGENGIMKKKCTVLQKDLEDQKDEQKGLQDKEKLYHEQIRALEKEVAAHKKEIKARDLVIGEKEKRIYELKKKNQELDKFKFVLDFKIRELKRQIEPRQQEIAAMKDQIRDMDAELEKYHTSNTSLDELIGTLRKEIDTTLKETGKKRMQAKTQENNISAFKSDVQMTIAHILDPQALYEAVEKLVQTHDTQGKIKPTIDPELESEYSRHRQFLERSIKQMQKVLADETLAHQDVNMKLMRNNLDLIGEINAQRDDNKTLRQAIQAEMGKLNALGRSFASGKVPKKRMTGAKSDASFPMTAVEDDSREQSHVDPVKMLEQNRRRMMAIRGCIGELEDRLASMKPAPVQLPPMGSENNSIPTDDM